MKQLNPENKFFNKSWFKQSDYPSNFIPSDAEIFIGIDRGEKDCTIKGFYSPDGSFHIQEVEYSK